MSSEHGVVICTALALAVSAAILAEDRGEAATVRQLAASCAGCHGTDGRGEAGMPVLAALSKDYFLEQMRAFATGERKATVMHQLVSGYSKEQLEQLADYFSTMTR